MMKRRYLKVQKIYEKAKNYASPFLMGSVSRKLLTSALAFAFCISCATPKDPLTSREPVEVAPVEEIEIDRVRAELGRPQVEPGHVTLLEVYLPEGHLPEEVEVRYLGKKIPIFPLDPLQGEHAALIAVPYGEKPRQTQVRVSHPKSDLKFSLPIDIIKATYPSERLRVDPSRVIPKKKDLVRIRKEVREIKKLYKRITPKKFWNGPFDFPIHSKVTSQFGTRRVFNGKLKSFHTGLDLKAAMGTPIKASASGEVVLSKNLFYTGNTVMIDHGYGIITLYAHLDQLQVKRGDQIERGQVVGLSGKTGRVSGPHLHWQAIVNHVKVNPADLTQVLK